MDVRPYTTFASDRTLAHFAASLHEASGDDQRYKQQRNDLIVCLLAVRADDGGRRHRRVYVCGRFVGGFIYVMRLRIHSALDANDRLRPDGNIY